MTDLKRNLGGFLGPNKTTIHEGDLVIMYQGFGTMTPVWVTKGDILNNRHGHFYHDDLIGKPFGTKVFARTSQAQGSRRPGWMHALQPTAELWSNCVTQRTQIVQPSDQAVVISKLWLRGGSVVLESGTGSGIFTTALARIVAPAGHVHTFEFNEHRAKVAAAEFIKNELDQVVTVSHRDICGEGFPSALNGLADAVFLDVPNPWLAINHAKRALKAGGRLCTYSPCIEQVQRSCAAFEKEEFHSIQTIEVRLRQLDVKETTFVLPSFTTKEDKIAKFNEWKERKAHIELKKAAALAAAEKETAEEGEGGKEGEEEDGPEKGQSAVGTSTKSSSSSSSSTSDKGGKHDKGGKRGKRGKGGEEDKEWYGRKKMRKTAREPKPTTSVVTACPAPLMRGHTAFLSFATRGARE
jgi:tRNA (adenine57-N1/adenine58-N1)-methyltransferase